MINLHTGMPGNGKTLYTLSTVEKRRIKENRSVYYHNIKELKLEGWTELSDDEAAKWYDLPPGAIIVLDECQRLFPPRGTGAAIPKTESELQTHRHKGFDLYLITQDPTMVPSHLRKLCNIHLHMMRKFGSKWVSVHQFEGVRENVGKSRKDSIETQWIDDVSMYDKYKSAEVITQKFRVPYKLLLAGMLPFLIIGGAVYFYQKRLATPETPAVPVKANPALQAGQTGQPIQKKTYDLAAFAPRIEGLPHTAPRYDELTVPVRVPTIVGCVQAAKGKAHCYTQQGTRITPPGEFIAQFIERGMFEDYDRGPDLGAKQQEKQGNQNPNVFQLTPVGRSNQNPPPGPTSKPEAAPVFTANNTWLESDAANIRLFRK